jgi:hypothetical protein
VATSQNKIHTLAHVIDKFRYPVICYRILYCHSSCRSTPLFAGQNGTQNTHVFAISPHISPRIMPRNSQFLAGSPPKYVMFLFFDTRNPHCGVNSPHKSLKCWFAGKIPNRLPQVLSISMYIPIISPSCNHYCWSNHHHVLKSNKVPSLVAQFHHFPPWSFQFGLIISSLSARYRSFLSNANIVRF